MNALCRCHCGAGVAAAAMSKQSVSPSGLDPILFCVWMAEAEPGAVIEYHRGLLGVDRAEGFSKLTNSARQELNRVAATAMHAADHGLLQLAQRRIGECAFGYLAIVRPRPVGCRINPAELVPEEA